MAKKKPAPKPKKAGTGKEAAAARKTCFAEAYIANGGNATEAAKTAGYSPATAAQAGSRLLRDVQVRAMVEESQRQHLEKVQRETGITLERTLKEIARGAFHDPRRFFDTAGNLKPIADLDDETAAALAGFDVTEEFQGRGEDRERVGFTKKIKLADRKGYLDMLMKHLGGYKKDNEQGGEATANALSALLGQMKRSALPVVSNPADE